MSETSKTEDKTQPTQSAQPSTLKIEVDRTAEIEEKEKELQRLKAEAEALRKELETTKKEKEEKEIEAEDLKSKLDIIAQKEFDIKKAELVNKVKDVLPPEKVKEIESSIQTPEQLMTIEKIVVELASARKAWEEAKQKELEEKKKAEAEKSKEKEEAEAEVAPSPPTGVAPLNKTVAGESPTKPRSYETYEAMVNDLFRRERSGDKEAKQILNEFFAKWVKSLKTDINARQVHKEG